MGNDTSDREYHTSIPEFHDHSRIVVVGMFDGFSSIDPHNICSGTPCELDSHEYVQKQNHISVCQLSHPEYLVASGWNPLEIHVHSTLAPELPSIVNFPSGYEYSSGGSCVSLASVPSESPFGKMGFVAGFSDGGYCRLFSLSNLSPESTPPNHITLDGRMEGFNDVAATSVSAFAVGTSKKGEEEIRCWDISTGTCVQTLMRQSGMFWRILPCDDESVLSCLGLSQHVIFAIGTSLSFWDLRSGESGILVSENHGVALHCTENQIMTISGLLGDYSWYDLRMLKIASSGRSEEVVHVHRIRLHRDYLWASDIARISRDLFVSVGSDESVLVWRHPDSADVPDESIVIHKMSTLGENWSVEALWCYDFFCRGFVDTEALAERVAWMLDSATAFLKISIVLSEECLHVSAAILDSSLTWSPETE